VERAERLTRLERLVDEPDPLRRRLIALGLLGDRLAASGIVPVIVGGTALAVYTAGAYSTKDLDLALPVSPHVDEAFAELGFRREGRYWFRPDLDLLFEAPAGSLAGEDAPRTVIDVDGLPVTVLGVEDLLIDRLRAWVHWKSEEDGRWARRLGSLYADRIDWPYCRAKTEAIEAERRALEAIEGEARREQ
jgi:hypothetical protein